MNNSKIKKDINIDRRLYYIVKRPNTVEFIKPPKNVFNNTLYNVEQPVVNGKHPECYYIDKKEYKELQDLFESFLIPIEIRPNLIFAYLNMVCVAATSEKSSRIVKTMGEDRNELSVIIDLIEQIIAGKKELSFITFGLKRNKEISKPPVAITFKDSDYFIGGMALRFIVDTLSLYKQSKNFDIVNQWKEPIETSRKEGRLNNHKNEIQYQQSFYSWYIYDYINKELSHQTWELYGKFCETNKESDLLILKSKSKELSRIYSQNKLYLLIGKMMILSKLKENKDKEFNNDKAIANAIKKKLAPYLKNRNVEPTKQVSK